MAANNSGSKGTPNKGNNNTSKGGSFIRHSALHEHAVHKPVPGKGGKGGK